MRQVIYAMCFTGKGIPLTADGAFLKALSASPSATVTSVVGSAGIEGRIEAIAGDEAVFESTVYFPDENNIQESGSITFGDGHRLNFSTVGSGSIGPSADPAFRHGTIVWRITGGEGQFAGASGLITSNFVVSSNFGISDYHFGVIWLP